MVAKLAASKLAASKLAASKLAASKLAASELAASVQSPSHKPLHLQATSSRVTALSPAFSTHAKAAPMALQCMALPAISPNTCAL